MFLLCVKCFASVQAQIGNLCLLASLSFPPPNLDSIPLVGGMEQRRKLEAWHTRSCRRLCVVSRQLLLVSRVKGDIYLGGLAKIIEGQVRYFILNVAKFHLYPFYLGREAGCYKDVIHGEHSKMEYISPSINMKCLFSWFSGSQRC